MSFKALGLRAELLSSVSDEGYSIPTPIQQKAIPAILEGRDVMGGAQTGTGKTAAFALPILQLLCERKTTDKRPRALILTPTRELAGQIQENIVSLGKKLRLKSCAVFGGVGIHPQIMRFRAGVDIITACPGRLLDHAGQKTVDLSNIEILVLDEADRMLDMGFIHDIRKLLALLPPKRQNLLFSATYSKDIERLAHGLLHAPVVVEVSKRNTAATNVEHLVHPVMQKKKGEFLSQLIQRKNWRQVLVFTRTKHGANRLARSLNTDGINAAAIHGNKSQSARTAALRDFKNGRVSVLVATDIASRGLDIDLLPVVVNYELPNVPEDYIHRIGRTGRAGASGLALSLVSREEQNLLHGIERLLRLKIKTAESGTAESGTADTAPKNSFPRRNRYPRVRANELSANRDRRMRLQ
jgi:ATP-dependent RNA helicase RhlE